MHMLDWYIYGSQDWQGSASSMMQLYNTCAMFKCNSFVQYMCALHVCTSAVVQWQIIYLILLGGLGPQSFMIA